MKFVSAALAIAGVLADIPACTPEGFTADLKSCATNCGDLCPEYSTYTFADKSTALVYLTQSRFVVCPESGLKKAICSPVQFMCESQTLDQTFGPSCVTSCGGTCPSTANGTKDVEIGFKTNYLGRSKPLKEITVECKNKKERKPCFFDSDTVAALGTENKKDIARKAEEEAEIAKAKETQAEVQRHQQEKKDQQTRGFEL